MEEEINFDEFGRPELRKKIPSTYDLYFQELKEMEENINCCIFGGGN